MIDMSTAIIEIIGSLIYADTIVYANMLTITGSAILNAVLFFESAFILSFASKIFDE